MGNLLTATHHPLDFNLLSPDDFARLCYWLAEDSGEYKTVDYYGGPGDKGRDVVGITFDEDIDYFQCKRYKEITYGTLQTEVDKIAEHVKNGGIKQPRRIYFVLSSSASPDAKDKTKAYAKRVALPEPDFWGPVVLDKKIRNNPQALKDFFNILSQMEQQLPQVDVSGLIATGTTDTRFTIVNNGEIPAIDCSWKMLGFAWGEYPGTPSLFNLIPQERKELRISMQHDFMEKNPIRELRLHFEYRDSKNNWLYSERFLNIEMVPSGEFFRIHPEPGEYAPAQQLIKFSIDSIESLASTGIRTTILVTYTHNKETRGLMLEISFTLQHGIWRFNTEESNYAIRELADRKIAQMIRTKRFEEKFAINSYLRPTQKTGFEAYRELRDSIV